MAWSTPKTDWVSADVIGNTDLNRIESNISAIADISGTNIDIGNDYATATFNNTIIDKNGEEVLSLRVKHETFSFAVSGSGDKTVTVIETIKGIAFFDVGIDGGSTLNAAISDIRFSGKDLIFYYSSTSRTIVVSVTYFY